MRLAQLKRDIEQRPRLDFGSVVPGGSDQRQMLIELDAMRAEVALARHELAEKTRAGAENESELQMQIDALRDKLEATELRAQAAESQANAPEDELSSDVLELKTELKAAFETIDRMQKAAQGKVEQMAEMQSQFQQQYFEVEQLRESKKDLQALLDEWRQRTRGLERERNDLKQRVDSGAATAKRLESEQKKNRERVRELEEQVQKQARELDTAEKRAEHLRQHLRSNK